MSGRRKPAGGIAGGLLSTLRKLPAEDPRRERWDAAVRFEELADLRNALMHGRPSAKGGAQRLFHNGDGWATEGIETATDWFAACSIELDGVLRWVLAA